ncbi:YdcF family protein [Erysipelotrichaceae bacterium OttesenSCG-928-M19]|nr:YdcF family protein [Erysipelotrichaceae bacterium OttesenSCG-928-M19]
MIKKIVLIIFVVAVLLYFVPFGFIYANKDKTIDSKVDYLIVLGAKVKEDVPTAMLQYRLDEAVNYYNDYSDVTIIVTGGQGIDESYSEAEVMKSYLIEHGVAEHQIIKEDKSTSTFENFKFAQEMLDSEENNLEIGFITNNFHVFRAKMICNRVFKQDCQALSAKNYPGILGLSSWLREPIAFYKSYFMDK